MVWRSDRLGSSLIHIIDTMSLLEKRRNGFRGLRESMDTTTSVGCMIFRIFGTLAQLERVLIRERPLAGLQAARDGGSRGGRPKVLDDDQMQLAFKLYDERLYTVKQNYKMLGISQPTPYGLTGG